MIIKIRKKKSGKYYTFGYKNDEDKYDVSVSEIKELINDGIDVEFEKMGNISDEEFEKAKSKFKII